MSSACFAALWVTRSTELKTEVSRSKTGTHRDVPLAWMQCVWLSSLRSLWTGLLSAKISTSFFLPFSSFFHCFPLFLSPHFSFSTIISCLFLSLHLNLSVSSIPPFPSLVTSMFRPSSKVFSLLFFPSYFSYFPASFQLPLFLDTQVLSTADIWLSDACRTSTMSTSLATHIQSHIHTCILTVTSRGPVQS